jgi:hypothetical protein
MNRKKQMADWVLVPSTPTDIEQVRRNCRRLVTRRALIAAGWSMVSIPGLVAASKISLFALLMDDIHAQFGLGQEQVLLLRPELKLMALEAMLGMGGVMLGKMALEQALTQLLTDTKFKRIGNFASKLVPIAGNVVSGTLGFAVFRTVGNQHVDACVQALSDFLAKQAK